jgi:hypothetical protein
MFSQEVDMHRNPYFYRGSRVLFSLSLLGIFPFTTIPSDTPETPHFNNVGCAAETASTQGPDLRSVDNLIKIFYESLSFPEGRSPDWDRFRSLFASATSPCVRMTSDTVMEMDREGFIAFFGGRVEKGTLRSFDEKEIGRRTETYGSLAQLFSTYEKRMNLADRGKPTRGINGFQLFFKDNRWWISSIAWQDELPEKPIPRKYLKRS